MKNTFTVPIEKEVIRINKNGKEIIKNISDILQFINNRRFMARFSSNLVNSLAEGIHRIKCKFGRNNKKQEIWELNVSIVTVSLIKNYRSNFLKGIYRYEYMDDSERFDETLTEKEDSLQSLKCGRY